MGPMAGRHDSKVMRGQCEKGVGWADADSEKGIVHVPPRIAILQTATVTVEYTNEIQR